MPPRDEDVARQNGYRPLDIDGRPLPHGWPTPIGEAAHIGIVGDFLRLAMPHTEADPNAVLAQFLTGFGNLVGRRPHWQAGADVHHANEFVVVVGDTSNARKGSSLTMALAPLGVVDREWRRDRVLSGLSSGEGLIHAVRDATVRVDPKTHEEVPDDPGVTDKRLLARETEFASPLRRRKADTNTLSHVLRHAWDGETLGTLTRNSPLRASNAHVSMIGHITRHELGDELIASDAFSGFANRILWIAATRSKKLPTGGDWLAANIAPLVRRLADAADRARSVDLVKRDREAERAWEAMYGELTDSRYGAYGSATARAMPHTMRLAMIYALLDRSDTIRIEHLLAGHEVWLYADETALMLFGDSTGHPDSDRLLRLLRSATELSRTVISEMLGRNWTADRIDAGLDRLVEQGRAERRMLDTGGRPAEVWQAYDPRKKRNKPPDETSFVSFVPPAGVIASEGGGDDEAI